MSNYFSEKRTFYETMWKILVQPERQQTTIWRMRIACWITKATDDDMAHAHCMLDN